MQEVREKRRRRKSEVVQGERFFHTLKPCQRRTEESADRQRALTKIDSLTLLLLLFIHFHRLHLCLRLCLRPRPRRLRLCILFHATCPNPL